MKKVIAINGSPRKTGNTVTLLQKALDGVRSKDTQTEIIHLYDLNYKGCVSCFSCKRKDNKHWGTCAMNDELTPVLSKVMNCDVLILGSPIYFADITGEMRSFLERLLFMNLSYDKLSVDGRGGSNFTGRIDVGFIFTMNVNHEQAAVLEYDRIFEGLKSTQRLLNGKWEYMTAYDTYQFKDYSKYAASLFDEKHKKKIYTEQFPVDCQKAFDLGERLGG
ncbi:MAG: flavodoxin family protein [Dysgonamonadaceae bacterium]